MQLSAHFSLDEMLVTSKTSFAQAQKAYSERPEIRQALISLCETVLEPVRAHVGRAIRVNSGLRCPELNAATAGASATSQHTLGQAADICVPGWTDAQLRELWKWIGWQSGLPFGQAISEDKRPDQEGGAWVHISLGTPWREAKRCGQRLTWDPTNKYRTWSQPP